jgi:hypothetical protein
MPYHLMGLLRTRFPRCSPSPCAWLSRAPTTMATLTLFPCFGGFRRCFQLSTSAPLSIIGRASHVHIGGLKREHVGGGYHTTYTCYRRLLSGYRVSQVRPYLSCAAKTSQAASRWEVNISNTFPHTDRPLRQGLETGVWFPVGRNPLRSDSPYALSAKRGILVACLAPHRYLSGACYSREWSVPSRLTPTAHRVPVHPREIPLIPLMRFMAHKYFHITSPTALQ